ncbi:MAG: PP2C family protein-serine/threonine phosphatase [Planctomycetota bacterium]
MADAESQVIAPSPPRIQCAEVWGGNHTTHTPVSLPGLDGVLFSKSCSGSRGGDIHYLSMCGSGILSRVCIADVAGHGQSIAAVGRETHDILRRHTNWPDHRRMLRLLNRSLERRDLHTLTTAAVLTYYPPSRRLSYSYAGHPPAWYYSAAADAWELLTLDHDSEGQDNGVLVDVPLAISPNAAFSRSRRQVQIGDRLLIVTDGVLEAPDASGRLFGAGRTEKLLREHRQRSLREISASLMESLARHCGTSRFVHDDVSYLLLEFTQPPPGPALWQVVRNRFLRPLGLAGGLYSEPDDS